MPEYSIKANKLIAVRDALNNAHVLDEDKLMYIDDIIPKLPLRVQNFEHIIAGNVAPMIHLSGKTNRDKFKIVPKQK
jgi:hypothetical protein